jgi:hypothetical protein
MVNKTYQKKNAELIADCIDLLTKKCTDLEFGTCSLILTFHSGQISKTEIQTAETMKVTRKEQ